jgi:hypothetical protein
VAEPDYYQIFTNIHLTFNSASGRFPALANMEFWGYGFQPNCIVLVRSFWQGKVALQGRDWQVGLVQNVSDKPGSFEDGRLLLRPWEARNRSFNTEDGTLASVPLARKIFLDGHAYKLDWTVSSQNGEARPALQFTEQSVPLGALNITGQFIRRLVLTGGPYLVVLDRPAGVVKIPVGSYIQPDVLLEQNGAETFCRASQQPVGRQITVDGKTTAVLQVGGPLNNSVIASRHGRDLHLDYRLLGVGGESYQLAYQYQNRSNPPRFEIYKGARKIASGAFEFG